MPQDRTLRERRVRVGRTALLFLCVLTVSLLIAGHNKAATSRPPLAKIPYYLHLSPPDEWDNWMPVAETFNSVTFTATTDASPPSASITFHLCEVTSREGRYMNDKINKGNFDSDLYFLPASEQNQMLYGGRIHWSGGGVNSTTITARWSSRPVRAGKFAVPVELICNDYAAYGKIHATLSVDFWPDSRSETITIPKDENDNMTADAWAFDSEFERRHLSMDREIPPDSSVPPGRNSGDGFTVLEEYRGFTVGDCHIRLHPKMKEVFLRSEITSTHIEWAEGSIGYAYNLPMYVYAIDEYEWDSEDSRVVNFCGGANPQKAIWIVESEEDADVQGRTKCPNKNVSSSQKRSMRMFLRSTKCRFSPPSPLMKSVMLSALTIIG